MAQRFRIFHVNANDDTLIETILFDTAESNTNNTPNFAVSNSGSWEGIGNQIVNNYSQISSCPTTANCVIKDSADGILEQNQGYNFRKYIDYPNTSVGDKFYLGRWDHSHSYLLVKSKNANINPPASCQYTITFDYCTFDGVVAYSNVSMMCQWINSRGSFEFRTLPWLWDWNSPTDWHINAVHLYLDLGQYGGYRANFIAPSSAAAAQIFWSKVPIIDPTNPYSAGGYSEPGGGDPGKQNFGDVSDMVNPDSLPDETQVGAVGCGLITIFTPSQAQLTRLAEMLWNKTFYDFLVNQFNAIEDLFVSLGIVPFQVTAGDTVAISFMNFWEYLTPGPIPTQVTLTKAAKQWEEFNLGNVSLTGGDSSDAYASDSVLDYSPYSKLGIYLPFIGYQEMDIDECRGRTINLKYRVDILSGACLALISINGRTLYQFTGNCMTQLPLTSSDYSQIVSTATNVSIAAASAGTAGALASAGDALTSSRVESGQISPQMGEYQNAQHAAQVSNAEGSLAGATANGLMGLKPSFKKTGAISGSTSIFGVMQPYLVLTTPKQSMPDGYNKVCGFPCNMGGKLGDFSGFTVVEDIRLNGLVATAPEVEEIYKLLKTGVII